MSERLSQKTGRIHLKTDTHGWPLSVTHMHALTYKKTKKSNNSYDGSLVPPILTNFQRKHRFVKMELGNSPPLTRIKST